MHRQYDDLLIVCSLRHLFLKIRKLSGGAVTARPYRGDGLCFCAPYLKHTTLLLELPRLSLVRAIRKTDMWADLPDIIARVR